MCICTVTRKRHFQEKELAYGIYFGSFANECNCTSYLKKMKQFLLRDIEKLRTPTRSNKAHKRFILN